MPIIHEVEHNSPEWHSMRCGLITSSEFKKIVHPTTGKLSQSKDKKDLSQKAYDYMDELIGEKATGIWEEGPWTMDMERGHILEPTAAETYELMTDKKTRKDVFVTDKKGMVGTSPDRLVDDDGCLEIKCPKLKTHVKYLRLKGEALEAEYKPQLQGQMWVTERKFVDIFSYHPEMQPALIRVERDEDYIAELAESVHSFLIKMAEIIAQMEERGDLQPIPEIDFTTGEVLGDNTILAAG